MIKLLEKSPKYLYLFCLTLFVVFSLLYNVIIPPFEGFDEVAHYSYISYLHTEKQLPYLDRETAVYSYELITQPPLYFLLSAIAIAPLPMQDAHHFAWSSLNPYLGSLSKRQTVALPDRTKTDTMPVHIARLISMLGGLLTLSMTWMLVRLLFPNNMTLALAVVSIVGLNPQFLFMTATVTNDGWSAGTVALSVTMAAYIWRKAKSPSMWFIVGACAGCAVLTKYSGFLLALPISILFFDYVRKRSTSQAIQAIGFAMLGAILVAGGWYLRNIWLWGELIPLNRMAEALPTMLRPEPYNLAKTLAHIPWLIAAYWGVFVSIIAPVWYLESTQWFMVIGTIGLPVMLLRTVIISRIRENNSGSIPTIALMMAIIWCSGAALSVLHWTRTIDYGEQGRLLHIAAPAFSLLWVLGWQAWFPRRWQSGIHILITLIMIGAGISQIFTLHSAYQVPTAIAQSEFDRPIQAQFVGGMKLLGLDLPEGGSIKSGDTLPLRLYFSTNQVITEDYTLFIHLADETERLLYQFDGVPAQGRHTTRQWQPGDTFVDQYDLEISLPVSDELATLSLGFYENGKPSQRQSIVDYNSASIGDRAILGKIRLRSSMSKSTENIPQRETLSHWEQGISLLDVEFTPDQRGIPEQIELTWQAHNHLHEDYTIFVQMLNERGELIAQIDEQPQVPTSTWLQNEIFQTEYHLSIDRSLAPQQLIVGWYGQDGQRLLLEEDGESNYWILWQNQ